MSWDVDKLKEYFDRRFDDSDKAIQAALVAQEKAIIKAEAAAERRFELLNELRQGVATREQLEAIEKTVTELANRITRNEGSTSGSELTVGKIYGAIFVAVAIISTVVLLVNLALKK